MGAVYRETYTKPMPDGAETFTRKGERFARWTDKRGCKQTAKVTTGRDGSARIVRECRKHTAKLRDGSGRIVKVATGCRTKDAAASLLKELQDRADKVRCGSWSAAEDSVLDHKATQLSEHVETYLDCLRNKRGKGAKPKVSRRHVANVEHCLNRIIGECGFKRLRDLNRPAVERWADKAETSGMAARTINAHLTALTAFGNWCVEAKRIVANPFGRPPKRDEKADPRRKRRALTGDEIRRLLIAARWRSLAEYGRATVRREAKPNNKQSRSSWTKAPLTFADLDTAAKRAREALVENPEFVVKLERQGRERALIYKTLVLTGLRKGELGALTVGHVELDGATPYIVLDAADEKAGRGAEIPIRADLADDLRAWIADALKQLQERARSEGKPIPARLMSATKLFKVPSDLIRAFDRDLVAAGIARIVTDADGKQRIDKRDERGRTVDIHALRHTFGTHLSKGGVAPRTAQAAMRHGTLELTMNTYTDPKLLDVAGALNALPDLPLDDDRQSARARATGTDDSRLVPGLVPNSGNHCTHGANADNSGGNVGAGGIDVTVCADTSSGDMSNSDSKRANGFEPSTFSLEGSQVSSEVLDSQDVTSDHEAACTNACTKSPETVHSHDAEPSETVPLVEHFAEAVAMLARLPLSDAERAEALRRLLAGQ